MNSISRKLAAFLLAPLFACTTLRTGARIQVAPPVGDQLHDRAALVAAFAMARPGDSILFAAGTYEVGPIVRVTTPDLTLLGHPDGTTLRGGSGYCDGKDHGTDLAEIDGLGVLHLFEGGATVRGLTFADSFWGLILGWHYGLAWDDRSPGQQGAFTIEGNTFRNSRNGVRATSSGPAPTCIRDNTFVDVHQGISGLGSSYVIERNRFARSGASPAQPLGTAIALAGEHVVDRCSGNRVLDNHIDDYASAVVIYVDGERFGDGNVIRGNRIKVRTGAEPSVGIDLHRRAELDGDAPPTGGLRGVVVEQNHIAGAEAAAISVGVGCDDTRITANTFADLTGPAILLGGARAQVRDHAPGTEIRRVETPRTHDAEAPPP